MIYGKIANENSSIMSDKFNDLKDLMMWSGCIHHEIEYGNFTGGLIYNRNLPYNLNDFHYIDTQQGFLVLMSGVIYNHEEIKDLLGLSGVNKSCPELVLISFIRWGELFINKLNGDFAICIYQLSTNNLFLYRDHMGIRPISFYKTDKYFVFSTDTLSLCKAFSIRNEMDRSFLLNLLVKYGLQYSSLTVNNKILPNSNVHRILPGHYIKYSNLEFQIIEYWNPDDITENPQLDFKTAIEEIRFLITDSVKIRCDNRFVASTHLSGGLDSGIVSSLVRKEYKHQKEFYGFCWSPPHPVKATVEFDERELVNKLGHYIDLLPVFITIVPDDLIDYLSDWRNFTYIVSEKKVRTIAQDKGINLIFSGWGGDEFVSINDTGINSDLVFKLKWRTFFKRNPINKPFKLFGTILYEVLLPALALRFYSPRRRLRCYSKYIKLFQNEKVRTINDIYHWRSRRDMHLIYFNEQHIPERTEECFVLGCHSGIEYRYPLIDKRIVEFMMRIPSTVLSERNYSRSIIREISEGLLPEEVRWHFSKNDPVRLQALYELQDAVCLKLMNEIDEFKINQVLNFINFDMLIQDIDAYRKGLIKERPSKSFEILLFLKKAHEFTKVYFN